MESMGEALDGDKEKNLIKKLEKDYIQDCIAADQTAIAQDKKKKQLKYLHHKQLFSVLEQQKEEKR
jgi:hypothetical protein